MGMKLTVSIDKKDRTLPEDIKTDGICENYPLDVTSVGGISKYSAAEFPDPVDIELRQPLGHDKTLFDLFACKVGFKLKLTLHVPGEKGGRDDLFDVNISNLIPESLMISENELVLRARTLT